MSYGCMELGSRVKVASTNSTGTLLDFHPHSVFPFVVRPHHVDEGGVKFHKNERVALRWGDVAPFPVTKEENPWGIPSTSTLRELKRS